MRKRFIRRQGKNTQTSISVGAQPIRPSSHRKSLPSSAQSTRFSPPPLPLPPSKPLSAPSVDILPPMSSRSTSDSTTASERDSSLYQRRLVPPHPHQAHPRDSIDQASNRRACIDRGRMDSRKHTSRRGVLGRSSRRDWSGHSRSRLIYISPGLRKSLNPYSLHQCDSGGHPYLIWTFRN